MSTRTHLKCGVEEGYALWAKSYTAQPNPMFALEERLLSPLLPDIAGKNVLDLGCGTGRWLKHLASHAPDTLIGVDRSPEMLSEADRKRIAGAQLVKGNCAATGLPSHSFDLVLNSFVLSHVDDLHRFAWEVRRLLKPTGSAFVTDLHPDTALRLSWKRAFRSDSGSIEIDSTFRPLSEIIDIFRTEGLAIRTLLEPAIGEPERWIFGFHGRDDLFEVASSNPALLILQLSSRSTSGGATRFSNCRIALSPREAASGNVSVAGHNIDAIASRSFGTTSSEIDVTGYLALPGFINAHDHLDFALFPRMGRGGYRNAREWADDIYHPTHSPIREQLQIAKPTRLQWGALRNILCGVTSVAHHNAALEDDLAASLPVDIVPNTVWAHSLDFDSDTEKKFASLRPQERLVIHLAEGIDDRSRKELETLDKIGALGPRTIIVHGLALKNPEIELLNSRGTGLVWCPTSNLFLFHSTLSPDLVRSCRRAALGSDSSLTAAGDLLDDARMACTLGMPLEEAYELVTCRAASLFGLQRVGRITPDGRANLVFVADRGESPARRVSRLTYADIEMVVVGGKIRLTSPAIYSRLALSHRAHLQLLRIGDIERWVDAPVGHMMAQAATAGTDRLLLSNRPIVSSKASIREHQA